jgi:hypothetical protein
MDTGIKQAGARRFAGMKRFPGTLRKRAAVLAMTGTAVASAVVLAGPAGASPLAARPSAVTGAEHFGR